MKSILIDSDICLDVYLYRMPFYTDSAKLLTEVEHSNVTGFVSVIALANLYYILKKYKNHKEALFHLETLRDFTRLGVINAHSFNRSLQSGWKDFEDALQHFCAGEENCEAIITRNIDDYKKSRLPVFTPTQFLGEQM